MIALIRFSLVFNSSNLLIVYVNVHTSSMSNVWILFIIYVYILSHVS